LVLTIFFLAPFPKGSAIRPAVLYNGSTLEDPIAFDPSTIPVEVLLFALQQEHREADAPAAACHYRPERVQSASAIRPILGENKIKGQGYAGSWIRNSEIPYFFWATW
jgi:hypothetical protein